MKGKIIINLLLVVGMLAILAFTGGCLVPEGGEGEEGGFNWQMIAIIGAIFVIFYFLMIRPQQKKQKKQQQMTQELQRGDKVITIGGIFGDIESVSDDSVVLKVESGTTVRMAKSSIAGKRQEERPKF